MSSPIFQPSVIEKNVVQDSRATEAAAASPEAKEMPYPYCAQQTPPSTFRPPLPVRPAGGKHPISPGEMKTSMFNGAKNVRMGNININAIQAQGPTIAMNISQPQEKCKHEHECPIEGSFYQSGLYSRTSFNLPFSFQAGTRSNTKRLLTLCSTPVLDTMHRSAMKIPGLRSLARSWTSSRIAMVLAACYA
jgi:hypothetical protein